MAAGAQRAGTSQPSLTDRKTVRAMRARPRYISAGNIAVSLTGEPVRAVGTLLGVRHASADQRPSEAKFNDFRDSISPN